VWGFSVFFRRCYLITVFWDVLFGCCEKREGKHSVVNAFDIDLVIFQWWCLSSSFLCTCSLCDFNFHPCFLGILFGCLQSGERKHIVVYDFKVDFVNFWWWGSPFFFFMLCSCRCDFITVLSIRVLFGCGESGRRLNETSHAKCIYCFMMHACGILVLNKQKLK